MKTKLFTSVIAILLLAGILAIPVANVQAWGCRQKVTHFSGTADFDDYIPGVPQQIGDCVLWRGNQVWFDFDCSDERMTGNNHNTMDALDKPDGTGIMWGTHVFTTVGGEKMNGYAFGRVVYAFFPDGSPNPFESTLTARYVSFGDGYKVIWRYEGTLMAGTISGFIIEK